MSRRSARKTLQFCVPEALPRCKIRGSVFRKRARMPQPPVQLPRPFAHSHSAHTNTQRRSACSRYCKTESMALSEAAAARGLLVLPRIVLFGDSITEFSFQDKGWGASLANRLVRKCDVLNRGLSGFNTRWAKMVLPRLINKDHNAGNTLAVTIFFGTNDSALKDENPRQHVPLEEYADNLKSMICYLNSVDISKQDIILVTPPPVHEASWERECVAKGDKLNRLNSVTGRYAKACVKVAEECGSDVIDLWTLMQKGDQDFSCYLADGIHLSEKGNTFLANQLWTLLEKKVSTLPQLFSCWRDVDPLYPEASLLGTPTAKN